MAALLLCSAEMSWGATATQLVIFSGSYTGGDGCVTPSGATSFGTSDQVHVYFLVQNVIANDHLELRWINIDTDTWSRTHQWNETNPGNWCYTGMYANASDLGTGRWKVQGWVNGSMQIESSIFTIGTTATPPPTQQNYTGYVDAVNCDRMWGWAKNNSDTNETVQLDIVSDGSKIATVAAGDIRSDVGPHGWNFTTPASLQDLKLHTIRVKLTNTGQELRNSDGTSPGHTLFCSGTTISSANQWTYNTDASAIPVNGWWARLVKTSVSGNRYKYTIYVMMSDGDSIQNASAAVITNLRVGIVRGSYSSQVNHAIALTPLTAASSSWEDPPNFDRADSVTNFAFDLWGFVNPEVGEIWGVKSVIDDLRDLSQADVKPSSWLADKMLDENTYRVSRMGYTPSSGIFGGLQSVSGVSFSVTVDENDGFQPEFFLRAQTKLGNVVGLEIGLDRQALISRATYNPF